MVLFEIELEKALSKKYNYQLIFLGSFLKEFDVKSTSFKDQFLSQTTGSDVIEEITNSYPKTIFINPVIFRHSIGKIKKLEVKVLPTLEPVLKIDESIFSVPEFLSRRNFSLKGDITNREVLYQPEFSKWKSLKNTCDLSVFKFKVYILPDGRVLNVENLISIGDPVLDRYLASIIKNWIFNPLENHSLILYQGNKSKESSLTGFTPLTQVENTKVSEGIIKINLND